MPIIPAGMEWKIALYSGDEDLSTVGSICKDNIRLMPRSVMILTAEKNIGGQTTE